MELTRSLIRWPSVNVMSFIFGRLLGQTPHTDHLYTQDSHIPLPHLPLPGNYRHLSPCTPYLVWISLALALARVCESCLTAGSLSAPPIQKL